MLFTFFVYLTFLSYVSLKARLYLMLFLDVYAANPKINIWCLKPLWLVLYEVVIRTFVVSSV